MSTGLLPTPVGRVASALALGVAIATAPAAQPATNGEAFALERALPADTFAFATFAGLDALAGAGEELGLYKLFAEPDLQAFLKPALDYYTTVAGAQEEREVAEWGMVKGLLRGRLSVGVSGLTVLWTRDGPIPVPAVAASLELGDRRAQFDQMMWPMLRARVRGLEEHEHEIGGASVRELRLTNRRGLRLSFYTTYVGDTLLVATSRPLIERCLAGGEGSLATSDSFRRSRSKLGTVALNELFVNVAAVTRRLRGLMPQEWMGALQRLGADRMEAFYHASGVDHGDGRDVFYVDAPAPRAGLLTATETPVDRTMLEFVPAGANAVIAGRSEDRASWKLIDSVFRELMPSHEYAMFRKFLDREMRPFGFAIIEQAMDALGDQAVAYADVPKNGLIPNVVAAFSVRDEQKLRALLATLLEAGGVEVRDVQSGGRTLHLLRLPSRDVPMRPAYTIVGDRLIVSISLNGLRNALRRVDGGVEGSILESPAFKEAFRNLDHQGASSLMFADAKTIAAYGHNVLGSMLPTLVDHSDAPVDPAMLPLVETFTKHLHGWACVGRSDGDGHVTTVCAPISPGGLLPLVGLFLLRAEGNPIGVIESLTMRGFRPPPPPRREG